MISTGSLLLGIALLLVVGLVVVRPLLSPSGEEATFAHASDPVTMRQALETQKDALLEQIRDLDFDRETGKVPEDRYRQRREALTAEAAAIFRRLDALAPAANRARPAPAEAGDKVILEDEVIPKNESIPENEIEAAVARLRKSSPANGSETGSKTLEEITEGPPKVAPEDAEAEIEATIAHLRSRPDEEGAQTEAAPDGAEQHSAEKGSRFCPQCGESHDPDDKFCAYCGHRLA